MVNLFNSIDFLFSQIIWGHIGLILDILSAVVIFLVFYLSRKKITFLITKIFLRLTSKVNNQFPKVIANSFQRPLHIFFIVLGIYLSLNCFEFNPKIELFILKTLRISIILLLGWGTVGAFNLSNMSFKYFEDKLDFKMDKTIKSFMSKIFKAIIIAFVGIIIIDELGYDVNGLIAGIGLGGLTFALAAQDTASNFFGGLVIIFDKPFAVDDWIETPTINGVVEDITFRSTRIRTFSDSQVVVPNAKLSNEPLTNWSRMNKRRVSVKIGATYSSSKDDIKKVIEQINDYLINCEDICSDTVMVKLDGFGESSIDIFVYYFTKTTVWKEFLTVKENVNFKIMDIMKENNVGFAFPSRSLYIEQNDSDKK